MRYQPNHAATSDSVPFTLRGPKSLKMALSAAVATAIGLTPALLLASPAQAATLASDLTIADATAVTEGGDLSFALSRSSGVATVAATYSFTAVGSGVHPATAGTDFTATSAPATVTFAIGETTKTVVIHTTDDALYEPTAETLTLSATDTNGAVVQTDTGTGTINDNDPIPSYTLTATSPITESSTSKTTVTATLSARSGVDTTINLSTANGTAIAGSDYTALPGGTAITIAAGSLSATQDIAISNDNVKDQYDTETFTVNGSGTNVSPATQSVQVSIVDAQSTPTLTLTANSATEPEGTAFVYTVTASPGASESPITVNWDAVAAPTKANTNAATPGDDFPYPSSRVITIPAGSTTATFSITPTVDNLNELNEDFAVQLSTPNGATLGTTTKVVSEITNAPGDTAPTVLSVTPTSVTEGDSGVTTKTFTATLSAKSGRAVTADWNTVSNTAIAGKDFKAADGTLTFPAGTTTQTFSVDIIGDTVDEGASEAFAIHLAPPLGQSPVSLTTGADAPIVITDDDNAPTFTFGSLSMKEGDVAAPVLLPIKLSNGSDHALTFNLTLPNPGTHTPIVTATTLDQGNAGDNDYQMLNTAVVIPAGLTTGYAVLQVNGDVVFEADESGYIDATVDSSVSSYVTGSATLQEATLTLTNDDKAPNLEVNSITGNEGDTVHVTGTVTGTAQDDTWVTVSFAGATVNGSKAADTSDFTNPGSKIVSIDGGTPTGSIVKVADVDLTNDTTAEPAETILVTGMGLQNSGTVTSGVITIAASDGGTTPPTNPTGDITLKADKKTVVGVGSVNLSGTATAGASVQLWAKVVGHSTLAKFGNPVTADSDGDFSFNAPLTKNGTVFAVTSGDMTSDEVTVWLQEMPSLTGGSNAKGRLSLTVTGNPVIANQVVTIQRAMDDGTWVTVASGKTNSAGKWTKTWSGLASKSSMTYRAWAAGNGTIGLLSGNSVAKSYTVM